MRPLAAAIRWGGVDICQDNDNVQNNTRSDAKKNRQAPGHSVRCGPLEGRHAGKEGCENDESKDGDPLDILDDGAVDTGQNGCKHSREETDTVVGTDQQRIVLVEREDFVGKVRVGRNERQALGNDAVAGNGKVACEQIMVEETVLLEPGLIDNKQSQKEETKRKGNGNVRVRPGVRVLGPGKAEREQNNAGRDEKVADPVELDQFCHDAVLALALQLALLHRLGRVVGKDNQDGRHKVDAGGKVKVCAEAV